MSDIMDGATCIVYWYRVAITDGVKSPSYCSPTETDFLAGPRPGGLSATLTIPLPNSRLRDIEQGNDGIASSTARDAD